MNTKPVTVGADVTVDVWFVCRIYICTKARHIPLHQQQAVTGSNFRRRFRLFLGQCSIQENFTRTNYILFSMILIIQTVFPFYYLLCGTSFCSSLLSNFSFFLHFYFSFFLPFLPFFLHLLLLISLSLFFFFCPRACLVIFIIFMHHKTE